MSFLKITDIIKFYGEHNRSGFIIGCGAPESRKSVVFSHESLSIEKKPRYSHYSL
jgi:hypothetical protein